VGFTRNNRNAIIFPEAVFKSLRVCVRHVINVSAERQKLYSRVRAQYKYLTIAFVETCSSVRDNMHICTHARTWLLLRDRWESRIIAVNT
jgi:hypothetical protein